VSTSIDEPTIPLRLRRPLAAAWISLGLHGALIALIQVAPPASVSLGEPVIEARLVPKHTVAPVAETVPPTPEPDTTQEIPHEVPLLAPSETAEALPVAKPVDPVPVQPAPAPRPEPPAPAPPLPKPAPAEAQAEPAPATPIAPAPAVAITSSVDLTYYSARDVDEHPRALREIVPDYPRDADRRRVSGKVRLQVKLEADGRVSDIEVVSADPPEIFNDSALKAFRDARFAPARKRGNPVRALVVIEVVYDWEGRRLR